jgi:hemolysin III
MDRSRLRAYLTAGVAMLLFDLREPINALSHGAGMMLALPVTWVLWKRCGERGGADGQEPGCSSSRYQRIKALCMLIFGMTLIVCYGVSALFHGVHLSGEPLYRLQRLDHVGIYLLIAGTYTPVAWALMRGPWSWGTLTTVWTIALVCAFRVWRGGVMPIWVSTPVYLAMGWGALFCYFELAKTHSHSTLRPLPLGGVFYSLGAVSNLMRWPVLLPGVFGSHELLHFLVIAGSACHVFFMVKVVVPSPASARLPMPVNPSRPALGARHAGVPPHGSHWLPHFPSHRRRAKGVLPLRARN